MATGLLCRPSKFQPRAMYVALANYYLFIYDSFFNRFLDDVARRATVDVVSCVAPATRNGYGEGYYGNDGCEFQHFVSFLFGHRGEMPLHFFSRAGGQAPPLHPLKGKRTKGKAASEDPGIRREPGAERRAADPWNIEP